MSKLGDFAQCNGKKDGFFLMAQKCSEQLGGKVRPILGRFDQTNTLSEINT